jgi:hypothetical protein
MMADKRYKVAEVLHYDVIDTSMPDDAPERIVFNTRDREEADRVAADHESYVPEPLPTKADSDQ